MAKIGSCRRCAALLVAGGLYVACTHGDHGFHPDPPRFHPSDFGPPTMMRAVAGVTETIMSVVTRPPTLGRE